MTTATRIHGAVRRLFSPGWQVVATLWGASALVGILLTTAAAILIRRYPVHLWFVILAALLTVAAFSGVLYVGRWLRSNEMEPPGGQTALVQREGLYYLYWFTAHALMMATLGAALACLVVMQQGSTPLTLAFSAACLAVAACNLCGVVIARSPSLLAVCWQDADWMSVSDHWLRSRTVLILRDRFGAALSADSVAPTPRFPRLRAVLEAGSSAGAALRFGQGDTSVGAVFHEAGRRLREIILPFTLTFVVAVTLFMFLHPYLQRASQMFPPLAIAESNRDEPSQSPPSVQQSYPQTGSQGQSADQNQGVSQNQGASQTDSQDQGVSQNQGGSQTGNQGQGVSQNRGGSQAGSQGQAADQNQDGSQTGSEDQGTSQNQGGSQTGSQGQAADQNQGGSQTGNQGQGASQNHDGSQTGSQGQAADQNQGGSQTGNQ